MHDHTTAPSGDGTVVVDIGDDVGALVLYTTAAEHGSEIDIERADTGHRSHVAVRERRLAAGTAFAAVYPALAAGDYLLHLPTGARPVTISGGTVNEVHWP
jgi:Trk K+ transport system NAD-binding subunit